MMGTRAVLATLATGLALLGAGCGKSADEVEGDSSAAPPPTSAAAPESSAAASSEAAATDDTAVSSEAASDTAASAPESSASEPVAGEAVTTPAPTGPVDDVVWGVYRETNSLDPIYAFDYPENTVLPVLCDALLRQEADGTIAPGLATDISTDDPLNMVITLRDGVTFWDGTPLTAEDVVFSLERNRQPDLGGFYPAVLGRVDTITATGPLEVTLKMKEPDTWLRGELSSMAGIVVQKKYAEEQGAKFGTVDGGTMCTGPFKLDSWKTGEGVTVVKNDAYWDTSLAPQASKITFKGVPDDANVTSGLLTGELTGMYTIQLPTLDELRESDEVEVYEGPSYQSDALIVSSLEGALGDVKVRQALSMAIDRQGLIDTNYKGAGIIPHALGNPGTWGYAPEVFQAGWDALPELDAGPGRCEGADPGGRRGGQDDPPRHVGRAARAPRRGHGGEVGGGEHRPEGRARVDLGGQLHQLLHRPQGPRERRRLLHQQLRGLRRPGRPLRHARAAGRLAELRGLRQ